MSAATVNNINESSISSEEDLMESAAGFTLVHRLILLIFGPSIQKTKRLVQLNGTCMPPNYQTNIIKNSKYNVITFLPLVLYEQFHQFINIFYLGLTITQFIGFL